MLTITDLVDAADAFRDHAGGLKEVTLSHRMFGDSKRLGALRAGGEITVGRFNAAMAWLAAHWPEGSEMPAVLVLFRPAEPQEDAA